jgi:hypothetical protein
MFRTYSAAFRQLSSLSKFATLYFQCNQDELFPKLKYFNVLHFRHPFIKTRLFEVTRYVSMHSLLFSVSVFCVLLSVVPMDVAVALLSCFYVPHCSVRLYPVD